MRKPLEALVALGLLGAALAARSQSIQTVAGFVGGDEGRPAAQTAVGPDGVAVDRAGNVYFSEPFSHRVRKISAATGLLSTVVGSPSGTSGFSGDGGPAAQATLNFPVGIAFDPAGNLTIVDRANDRVRRVAAETGIITTVAGNGTRGFSGDGGPATSAALNRPLRVAVDAAGNVFFSEFRRVRKVAAGSGTITTVAGDGTNRTFGGDGGPATLASLRDVRGLTVDAAGNLFLCDAPNHRIRMVAASTGLISTFAGNGVKGFAGDGGPAIAAALSSPVDVWFDAEGRLTIADLDNHRVRRVSNGVISTVAGNGQTVHSGDGRPATSAALNAPSALAVDAAGNLLIADSKDYRIRRVDGATGTISTLAGRGIGDGGPATAAFLKLPAGIAFDRSGNLLIADRDNDRIRKLNVSTGKIETVAGTGAKGFSGDGGPAVDASFDYPYDVAPDPGGNIYVADTYNNRVRRIDGATGGVSTVAGDGGSSFGGEGAPATATSLATPIGLALDRSGALYIAEGDYYVIRKLASGVISTTAGILGEFGFSGDGGQARFANLAEPFGISVDEDDNLFIADWSNHRIRRVDARTSIIQTVAGQGVRGFLGDGGPAIFAALNFPEDVAVDRAGNVFIADTGNSRIRKVDVAGVITTVVGIGSRGYSGDGGPATAAAIAGPQGLAFDRAGNLYIADGINSRIRMVSACLAVTAPRLTSPGNGASEAGSSTTLSWDAVPGAFRYDVSLDSTVVAADLTSTSFTTSNLLPGTTYQWRVVAKGDPFCTPLSSAASEVRSFSTSGGCPIPASFGLVSPVSGAADVATSATLSWQPAAGASSYDLYLGTSSPPPLVASGLSEASFAATNLAAGSTYFWNVVAHAACDPAKTSATAVRSFRVAGACSAPGAFTLTLPAAGASAVTTNPTLTWTASPGATSYDVYIGTLATADPPLYLSGTTRTSLALSGLLSGVTYRWKVVAKSSCEDRSSAAQSFTVAGACAPPGTPSITVVPPGSVGTGQTYVIAWSDAPGLDAGGGYVVERSLDIAFVTVLDSQVTSQTSASFVALLPGRLFHRVRAVAGCDPARVSPPSDPRSVTVIAASPNVVFTVQPSAIVTALGEKLEEQKTTFALENIGPEPIAVLLGRSEIGSHPFFFLVDPAGGDSSRVTLLPRKPRLLEVHFSGPPSDRVASYQGLIFATTLGQSLAITPYAYVSLKVGGSQTATPAFRVNGEPSEYAFFPGASGSATGRPPITVGIHNPGETPMELGAEIGPELWLEPEPGWNDTPIQPGETRPVRLSTNRTFAPNGSALPRYTYFTVRTRSGQTARLLVQDNDAPPLAGSRTAQLLPGVRSYLIPSVVKAGSRIGNTFVSRVRLSNAGTEAVQADLFFTPHGADGFDANSVRRATVVIPPNDLVNLTDPLVQLFGLSPPIAGTLEVRTPAEKSGLLTITSSVDAPALSGGTFGFQMPTVLRGEGARVGSPHYVPGITASPGYRTNLILCETTGVDAAQVRATLYDRQGVRLGDTVTSVPRYGQRQVSGVVSALGGGEALTAGRIEIDVESGGGSVVALVTIIDNANDDAVTYVSRPVSSFGGSAVRGRLARRFSWAQASSSQKYLIPAVVNGFATFPGTGRPPTFRSLLGFTAAGLSPVTFALTYKDLESGQSLTRSVTVEKRGTVEYPNVLEQLFGLPAGARSQGPIFVEVSGNGLMYCKVYSDLETGTLGDGFPVVPIPSEGLTGPAIEKPLYADGLEQSTDRSRGTRSNLLLNEVLGQPTTVTVRLYEAGNRTSPIAERDFSLAPLEKLQLSTVFAGLGLDSAELDRERRKDRTNVLCVVTARGGGGLVAATVTTIDNRTGDTKNTLLTPNGGLAATGSIGF